MPSTMSLGGTNNDAAGLEYSDVTVALHMLGCIKVHDVAAEKNLKLTFGEIAAKDVCLRTLRSKVLRGYLLTFGRQSEPMLTRLLTTTFNMSEEEVNQAVDKVYRELDPLALAPHIGF